MGLLIPDSVQELHPSESIKWSGAGSTGIIVGEYKSSNGSPPWPGGGRVLDPKAGPLPDVVGGLTGGRGDLCAWSAGEKENSKRAALYAGKDRGNQELWEHRSPCAAEPPVIALPAILER